MDLYTSWEISSKANKWQGRNLTRYSNAEYDKLFRAAESEMDPLKRTTLFIRMNDLVIHNHVVIPLVNRARVGAARSQHLVTRLSDRDLRRVVASDWIAEAAVPHDQILAHGPGPLPHSATAHRRPDAARHQLRPVRRVSDRSRRSLRVRHQPDRPGRSGPGAAGTSASTIRVAMRYVPLASSPCRRVTGAFRSAAASPSGS